MSLVEFTKNAAGPPFAGDKVSFGPYSVGDVADLGAGSITKLGTDATKTAIILNGSACSDLQSVTYTAFQFIYTCATGSICIDSCPSSK